MDFQASKYQSGVTSALVEYGLVKKAFRLLDPSIAGPALGALGARTLMSSMYPGRSNELANTLGTILGASVGKSVGEDINNRRRPQRNQTPMGNQMDPTNSDIPAWAMSGAQSLQPLMQAQQGIKVSNSHNVNMLAASEGMGSLPYLHEGYQEGGLKGLLQRGVLPAAASIGTATLGHKLLSGLKGNLPGTTLPLNEAIPGMLSPLAGMIAYNAMKG